MFSTEQVLNVGFSMEAGLKVGKGTGISTLQIWNEIPLILRQNYSKSTTVIALGEGSL